MFKKSKALVLTASLACAATVKGQNFATNGDEVGNLQLNTITTAVPFLMIAPDSRSGAMGDIGVSLSTDANATHWNLAKSAFTGKKLEMSISYTPWLRQLVPDINLAYVSGVYQLEEGQALGVSMRYFSLGDITFTDPAGNVIGSARPNEFALDAGYSRKLTDRWSAAVAGRFIYSNLTQGYAVQGQVSKAGVSGAADISAFYENDDVKLGEKDAIFRYGINISNIGAKMSYTASADRDFIPTNLRMGPSMTMIMDDYNKITFGIDFNKLLVPTPPIYDVDSLGNPQINSSGDLIIASGKDPNVGVATGIFQSFTDAPGVIVTDEDDQWVYNDDGTVQVESGSRFKEELREINLGFGFEYLYGEEEQLALRTGYFHEATTKGNRKYFTVGAGLHYTKFTLDFAYLIPTQQRNPLANTLRFTLRFGFDELGGGSSDGGDDM